MSEPDIHITIGSIFHDAELNFPPDHRIKAELIDEIGRRMENDGLTQAKVAARMGIAQPDLSNILHGKFRGFTVDRLIGMLARLWLWCGHHLASALGKRGVADCSCESVIDWFLAIVIRSHATIHVKTYRRPALDAGLGYDPPVEQNAKPRVKHGATRGGWRVAIRFCRRLL